MNKNYDKEFTQAFQRSAKLDNKKDAPSAEQNRKDLNRRVNFRLAEKPPIMPACRNCKGFTYTASERCGMRGDYIEKIGKRCTINGIKVTSNVLCDLHGFKHNDHRDV